MWWNPALQELRQEDVEQKSSLGYKAKPSKIYLQSETNIIPHPHTNTTLKVEGKVMFYGGGNTTRIKYGFYLDS